MIDEAVFKNLEPGTKLLVSSAIDPHEYHPCTFCYEMLELAGQVVTVKEKRRRFVTIAEDKYHYVWDWTLFDAVIDEEEYKVLEPVVDESVMLFV